MVKTKVKRKIRLEYFAPEAHSVRIAGDFNNWDTNSIRAKKDKSGLWKTEIAVTPGRYQYKFLVDDQWKNDPKCNSCTPNSFGSLNCLLDVK